MADKKDYAEELFDAISILMNKKIESIQYDKTIVATVVDDSKADKGIYTVLTDNAKFIAYSDIPSAYRNNDPVMVTIPLGDFSKQKIICGKYVDNANTPMAYTSPFQEFIDISNNIIKGEVAVTYWANGDRFLPNFTWSIDQPEFQDSDAYHNSAPNQNPLGLIWDSNDIYGNGGVSGFLWQGYTRLGLSAQFSTWLSEYETIQGNYGIAVELTFKCLDIPDDSELPNSFIKIITFDSDEFFGDVYNFETYYTQEKLYDISEYVDYPISRIRLFAYQRENFKNNYGEDIYVDVAQQIESGMISINPNIAIKDPYICLGIPIEDFESDSAELFCADSSTYKKYDVQNRDEENAKEITLRWVHKYETNNVVKVVSDADFPKGFEVRWYKFKLGAQSDQFARADWTQYLESGTGESTADQLFIVFQPDVNVQQEQVKAVIIKNETEYLQRLVAVSNILTFTNQDKVQDLSILLDANALSIRYDDIERGHYFLYDEAGDISKNEDGEVRRLTAVFSRETNVVDEKPDLNIEDCSSIKWIFPEATENTMIIPMNGPDKTATPSSTNIIEGVNQVGFTIKKHLNNVATNNTIRLEITKDDVDYTAQVQPIFGTAGTNGSDYTLILTWQDDKNAFDIGEQSPGLVGELALYDQSGDPMQWPTDVEVRCDWCVAEFVTDGTAQIHKVKARDEEDLFYPVLSNSKSLFYGSTAANSYQQNDFYYFTSDGGSTVYYFDLDSNTFTTRVPNPPSQPYIKGKKNKLEFQRVTFTTEPLNQETGQVAEHNPPIYIDVENNKRCYSYSRTQRYFIKYKDRYIIDPWDNYQEAETYYEPIEAKECVYERISNGNQSSTIGSLVAAVDNEDNRLIHISSSGTIDMNSLFILEVTLNNFGDYPLVNYYPIALKNSNSSVVSNYIANSSNFIVDYIEGPDRVRYDSSGKVSYNRNPYQITTRVQVNNNLLTYRHGYPNNENYLPGYWRLLLTGGVDTFSPALEETVEDPESTYNIPILYPASVYIPNNEPYGVQFIYTPDTNPDHNVILWTQPILVYESRYPSRTINKWDGKEILTDENAGTITASGFSAGKKERDNSFTGVMIGDWSRSVADTVITKNTGIYGFNHGAMAYAFKDDGTGFIGKDGFGRIYFDGGKAQIFSSKWTNTQMPTGMLLDIDDGFIKMQSLSVAFEEMTSSKQVKSYFLTLRYPANATKKLYIQSNSDTYTEVDEDSLYDARTTYYKKNGDDFVELTSTNIETTYFTKKTYGVHEVNKLYLIPDDLNSEVQSNAEYNDRTTYYSSTGSGDKYITIGSNQTYYPLSIGQNPSVSQRDFRVSWDGTTYINNGEFTGVINATGGSIDGNFLIRGTLQVQGTLHGGTISGADIYGGSISGAVISSGNASISNGTISGATITGASVTANYLKANNGEIGGWKISSDGLTSVNADGTAGKTTLHKMNGITTNTITISDDNASGQIGYVPGLDSGQNTAAFGIKSTTHSVILESGNNVALKAPNDAFIQGGYGYGTNGSVAVSTISAKYTPNDNTKPGIELITSEPQGVLIQAPRVDIGTSNNTTRLYINGNEFDGSSYAKFAPDNMNNNSGS